MFQGKGKEERKKPRKKRKEEGMKGERRKEGEVLYFVPFLGSLFCPITSIPSFFLPFPPAFLLSSLFFVKGKKERKKERKKDKTEAI